AVAAVHPVTPLGDGGARGWLCFADLRQHPRAGAWLVRGERCGFRTCDDRPHHGGAGARARVHARGGTDIGHRSPVSALSTGRRSRRSITSFASPAAWTGETAQTSTNRQASRPSRVHRWAGRDVGT